MRNPFGGQVRLKFRGKTGGYTILEVMIFIAISGLLLATATVVVGNKQAHTEFITSANDVNTKMRQWINQVANGFTANPSSADSLIKYTCTLVPEPTMGGELLPKLSVASGPSEGERGTNPECVFLGKAVQVNTNGDFNDKMFAYTVLGRRTYVSGGETVLVTSLALANPAAAISGVPSDPNYIDLTEEYNIPNGTIIKSVSSETPDNSMMGGFFTSFSSTNASNGAQSLLAVQYPMPTEQPPRSSTVLRCIQLADECFGGALPDPPSPMDEWTICLASTRNTETARVILTSIDGRGVNTRLEFTDC